MDIYNNQISQAMILAAGEGTRLKPLTLESPKSLLPIGEAPLICYILTWLKKHGIQEVVINLHYLGAKIIEEIGSGSRFGIEIHYSSEETMLGTAGGVKKVENFFRSTFIVVYGDVFTDFDLSAMMKFHQEKKPVATLAVSEVPNPWETGIVRLGEDGRIISFIEKPPKGTEVGNMANGGIYVLERQVFDFIPQTGSYDFAYDVFPNLIRNGLPVYAYPLNSNDYLIDIGSVEKYNKANQDFLSGKVKLKYGK